MRLDRRTLLGTIVMAAIGAPVLAQQAPILRVQGEVTSANYKGLEAFLFNSLDTIVGLKVSFPREEGSGNGGLTASADGEKFVAYLSGPGSESEIVANEGFSLEHGSYVFDAFFVVKSGGMHQGIISLFLARAEESAVLLSGVQVKEIRIDRLDPKIRE